MISAYLTIARQKLSEFCLLSFNKPKKLFLLSIFVFSLISSTQAQGTRLLRQPNISSSHVVYTYGGDIWISSLNSHNAVRLTSTQAVEKDPFLSPDGKFVAFTSNRSGMDAIYSVSIDGGTPTRLTWHPSPSRVRGWTPDGKHILYSSTRETAPSAYDRLWTVSVNGGPSEMLTAQWGTSGSFSPDGKQIVIDRVRRWDVEWRNYRGGQNSPLEIINLKDLSETFIPNESTFDILPVWMGETIYFLSDRDWTSNIWAYSPKSGDLKQITKYTDIDIKWLAASNGKLSFERDGYLHILDPKSDETTQLNITVTGDFPWAETKWEDVSKNARSASISPNGKRAIMESRGEIFTIPVEFGDARNLTQSSDAADRTPIWSPKGDQIAWFSDANGTGYSLMISTQDGLSPTKSISIGESKLGWEPDWSPDGKFIAFVDDDVRMRVVNIAAGTIQTIDVGGNNLERGSVGLSWSPDSQWLAYAKSGSNNFRQIKLWSLKDNKITAITDPFADSFSPSWDLDKKHLYFLASTDVALGSGWANTSAMTANPVYAAYVVNLQKDEPSPFKDKSDEEAIEKEDSEKKDTEKDAKKPETKKGEKEEKDAKPEAPKVIQIDFDGIERRTMALPIPSRNYTFTLSGPSGILFIAERIPNSRGLTIQKFDLKESESKEFASGVNQATVSANGKQMLLNMAGSWKIVETSKPNAKDAKSLKVDLKMKLDRTAEWKQMFNEAWRYEGDYFYDPNMHGRDWKVVYERYAPLIPFVKHRSDLTYILDQVNGELSVGHSFVMGGDFPEVEPVSVGLLGADLVAENNRWKIKRIYTTESWNPELSSPLDQPGTKIQEGFFIVGINGKEITAKDNPYEFLDGTVGKQTVLHLNKKAEFEGSWKEIVKPIRSENALRQRAWVEDNRRLVDKLSNGRLGYIWVPNTGGPGFVSFNRYFFAQQDKEGAVIDERFNGGGSLDDYMVDLMTRSLRAALTNEVPNGKPLQLPAGILGPKVLLINELAGSGGDYFPWAFRQQKIGPLIGSRTWGGLVKSSVHYSLVDGGALTAPDNAVFDPINNKWVAENEGVAPDIEVRQDAKSLDKGIDPQLERAVKEALLLINKHPKKEITPPPFPTPAIKK
ncbi:MAG: PDZ domain-containing protein [Bacteroidetes bacterium]|nr:PDZ domain-containing protein [Bacteroidota bacterium]